MEIMEGTRVEGETILALPVARRVRLEVGEVRYVNLTLVGCGGTGSFLALHLARLAYHARERGMEFQMTFVDPDRVEARNVGRQNFVPAEIGQYKAQALATRYGRGFGLQIRFLNRALEPDSVDQGRRYRDGWLHLVAGCVDNVEARAGIMDICRGWSGRLWWLDTGNHDQSGQVILGNSLARVGASGVEAEISPLGFCVGLPLPSLRHPELVKGARGRKGRGAGLRRAQSSRGRKSRGGNCAVDLEMNAQSLMVNQMAAGWAASYVYRMALARDLDCWGTYFDLAAGSARSEYIVKRD